MDNPKIQATLSSRHRTKKNNAETQNQTNIEEILLA